MSHQIYVLLSIHFKFIHIKFQLSKMKIAGIRALLALRVDEVNI